MQAIRPRMGCADLERMPVDSPARTDGGKLELLAKFGVQECRLVGPIDQTVEPYTLDGSVYVLDALAREQEMVSSTALPGLVFHGSRIFAR